MQDNLGGDFKEFQSAYEAVLARTSMTSKIAHCVS